MSRLPYWIWLTTRKRLTLRGQQLTLSYFGSPEAAFEASPREIAAVPGLIDREREALEQRDWHMPRRFWRCAAIRESESSPVRTRLSVSGCSPSTVRRWCSIIAARCWTLTSCRWWQWWALEMPAPMDWQRRERWATRLAPAAAWWYPARQRALILRRWRVRWRLVPG